MKAFIKQWRKTFSSKRSGIFNEYLQPSDNDRILDLGSEDGSRIAGTIPFRDNVFIADISQKSLNREPLAK
jgi:hypothetical protein